MSRATARSTGAGAASPPTACRARGGFFFSPRPGPRPGRRDASALRASPRARTVRRAAGPPIPAHLPPRRCTLSRRFVVDNRVSEDRPSTRRAGGASSANRDADPPHSFARARAARPRRCPFRREASLARPVVTCGKAYCRPGASRRLDRRLRRYNVRAQPGARRALGVGELAASAATAGSPTAPAWHARPGPTVQEPRREDGAGVAGDLARPLGDASGRRRGRRFRDGGPGSGKPTRGNGDADSIERRGICASAEARARGVKASRRRGSSTMTRRLAPRGGAPRRRRRRGRGARRRSAGRGRRVRPRQRPTGPRAPRLFGGPASRRTVVHGAPTRRVRDRIARQGPRENRRGEVARVWR